MRRTTPALHLGILAPGGIEPDAAAALLRERAIRTQASMSHWSAVQGWRE